MRLRDDERGDGSTVASSALPRFRERRGRRERRGVVVSPASEGASVPEGAGIEAGEERETERPERRRVSRNSPPVA